MMALRSSDLWGNSAKQFPRSFEAVIEIYFDKAAASLNSNALAAFPTPVVWLNVTERRRRYLTDHGYIFLEFLLAGIVELRMENRILEVDESVSLPGLTSLDVLLLEKFTWQTSWSGEQIVRITMLSKATTSLLKPLKWDTESGFEVSLGDGETQKCFAVTTSYHYDNP